MTEGHSAPESGEAAIILRVFERRMLDAVRSDEDVDFHAQREMERTNRITRFSLVAALVIAPAVFFQISSLVLDMGVITERMGAMATDVHAMRKDFNDVSALVGAMDASVGSMGQNIAYVPPIASRVGGMRGDLHDMVASMGSITGDVVRLDDSMGRMDHDMAQMNAVFDHLNVNVHQMGRDVHTMSSPMRMMPFFGK